MKIFFIIILFIAQLFCEDDSNGTKIPKLDLRNFGGSMNKIKLNQDPTSFIPKDQSTILFDSQIDDIKTIAKEFNPQPLTDNNEVSLSTNFGPLKFKLYHKYSPINCLNFKKLANSGFYDKTLFHHSVPKFLIQGGDILTRNHDVDDDGFGGPGWVVNAEFSDLTHSRGTLSMIRSKNDQNSAGSQFFISFSDNKKLDGKYTIIGDLIEGDHVLSRIEKIPSEYKQALLLCRIAIPDNENPDNWIEIDDPVSGKKLFSKVPLSDDKNSYSETLTSMINNLYRPGVPIMTDSIRVYSK